MENYKKKFTKIYDQHIDKIYRFIFLKVGSAETAEDLTAQVFTRGWKKFKSGEKIKNESAYLFQIARTQLANFYRQEAKYKIVSVSAIDIEDSAHTPEEEQKVKGEIKEMQDLLGELKEQYQDILILRYIDDYSISDIALMLNKSEGAVRVMLHRALGDLRKKIKKEY